MAARSSTRWFAALALAAGVVTSTAPPSEATIYVVSDARPLDDAAEIVVGEVVAATPHWDRGRIVTTAQVAVQTRIKGAPPARVTVEVEGGSIDGVAMEVIGGATLAPRERALLFLREVGGVRLIRGMASGKHAVWTDAGGVDRVDWNNRAVALVDVVAALRARVQP